MIAFLIIIVISTSLIPFFCDKKIVPLLIFVYLILYANLTHFCVTIINTPSAMDVYEGKTYLTIKDGDTIVDYISNRYKKW